MIVFSSVSGYPLLKPKVIIDLSLTWLLMPQQTDLDSVIWWSQNSNC